MKIPHQAKIKQDVVAEVEANLLKRLRVRGEIARIDLARDLKLAPSTVGIYVDRLVADGYIKEGRQISRELGRPAKLLSLDPEGGRFAGIDISKSDIYATCVDFSQKPIRNIHRKLPKNFTLQEVLKESKEILREVSSGDTRPLLGIGMGLPGAVDPEKGIGIYSEHFEGWENLTLAEDFEKEFDVPVALDHNMRAMAAAEMWTGLGKDISSFFCLCIRSGIGMGIVINGKLWQGSTHFAGEIGNCPCNDVSSNSGEYISISSKVSLDGLLKQWNSRRNGTEDSVHNSFLSAVKENEPIAIELLNDAARICGHTLGKINLLLNTELIIVVGPLGEFKEQFMNPLHDALSEIKLPKHANFPVLKTSQLGEYVGAMGAAALAVQKWKPVR